MKTFQNAFLLVFFWCMAALLSPSQSFSQSFVPPDGEQVIGTTTYSRNSNTRIITWSSTYVYTYVEYKGKILGYGLYHAPLDKTIANVIIRNKGSGPETIV